MRLKYHNNNIVHQVSVVLADYNHMEVWIFSFFCISNDVIITNFQFIQVPARYYHSFQDLADMVDNQVTKTDLISSF